MQTGDEIFRSIVLSLSFVLPGGFLCLFTMRERLRYPWPVLILQVILEGVVYYFLRRISWLGILPFLGFVFLNYRRAVNAQPNKILFIMMVVVTYLLFMNSVFYVFEGSAYTWDWDDLDMILIGFALSLPPMAWLLRRRLWPAICDVDTAGVRWLWTVPALFMALNVILNSSHIQNLLDIRATWLYTALTTLFALASTFVSFLVLDMVKKTQDVARYQEDLRIVDAQMHIQKRRFEEFQDYVEQIRVLRHDMRHHLRILGGMLSDGAYENAAAYLREYAPTIEEPDVGPVCANYVADLVIRRYQSLCKEQGVSMTVQVAIPSAFWMSDIDLCVVLGNALENALNACLRLAEGERYIHLQARAADVELGIVMENSCPVVADKGHGTMAPAEPSSGGGHGVPSIKAIAKKYGGMASFRREGTVFCLSMLMYRSYAPEEGGKGETERAQSARINA